MNSRDLRLMKNNLQRLAEMVKTAYKIKNPPALRGNESVDRPAEGPQKENSVPTLDGSKPSRPKPSKLRDYANGQRGKNEATRFSNVTMPPHATDIVTRPETPDV